MGFHVNPRKFIFTFLCLIFIFLLFHAYILSLLLVGKYKHMPSEELFTSVLDNEEGVAIKIQPLHNYASSTVAIKTTTKLFLHVQGYCNKCSEADL